MSGLFEDTVKNLLKMKPKPHGKGEAVKREKERRPDKPGDAGIAKSSDGSDD